MIRHTEIIRRDRYVGDPPDDSFTEDEIDAYVAAVLRGDDEEWVKRILADIEEMDDEPDQWTIRRYMLHQLARAGIGSRN